MLSRIKRFFAGTDSQEPSYQTTHPSPPRGIKQFSFLNLERGEEIEPNRWYRLRHWESQNFLVMKTEKSKDWKFFRSEEPVVGVSFGDCEKAFLILGDRPDFRISLRREPNNPVDKNAIMVVGSATIKGRKRAGQLGHLSKETAFELKDEKEIDARPHSVYIPYDDCLYGLKINVLVRSQAYLKRTGKATR